MGPNSALNRSHPLGGSLREHCGFFTMQVEREQELGPLLVHGKVPPLLGSGGGRMLSQAEQLQQALEELALTTSKGSCQAKPSCDSVKGER